MYNVFTICGCRWAYSRASIKVSHLMLLRLTLPKTCTRCHSSTARVCPIPFNSTRTDLLHCASKGHHSRHLRAVDAVTINACNECTSTKVTHPDLIPLPFFSLCTDGPRLLLSMLPWLPLAPGRGPPWRPPPACVRLLCQGQPFGARSEGSGFSAGDAVRRRWECRQGRQQGRGNSAGECRQGGQQARQPGIVQ